MAEQINAPSVEVKPDNKLSDEQFAIAKKIHDAAVENGLDPEFALRIGNIENRFRTGPSPAGALGPMQLMPGTAKMLKVDPNDIDQNIAGGVKHLKYLMDKYNDPYVAGMAYNAGEVVADKYLETGDTKVIPDETFNYVKMLHKDYQPADQVATGELPDISLPTEEATAAPQEDLMTKAGATIAGGVAGGVAGAYGEEKLKAAEKVEAKAARTTEAAEKKIGAAQERVEAKKGEHTGRIQNQTKMAESSAKEVERLRTAQAQAEERLAKAMDNARRYGVVEEIVKTTPGGVTQEGGLGSGAMRHSNVMGEVHEANVVRKGTEAAGPGYSQKSRLIVPDKYVNAEIYTPEQKAAKAELDRAQAEVDRIYKQAGKAEAAASREAERLRNLTERGPSGMTQAEAQLEAAKSAHAEAAKFKQPGVGTRVVRALSKIPGMSILPAAGAGYELADVAERIKRGDIAGAAISGAGAVGGGLSMLPPVTPLTAGLRALGLGLSLGSPAAQYLREENKPPQGVKFAGGGLVTAVKAAMEAEAKQAAKKEAIKASEALGQHEGKTLMTTQADRTKVGEGFLGGPGFSGIQLYDPAYGDVGATWAVGNSPTASTIISANKRVPEGQAVWIPMIGSPTQHKSNQMVFDRILNDFKKSAKKGNLDPELRDVINARIASTVDPKTGQPVFDLSKKIDILSPAFQKQLNTFDKRAAVADILGGKGVGGKKGSIIDYENIIRETTDPDLLDAPTGSLGSRLFTLSGERIERPDLHPAFPHVLTGEDLGVHFKAAPREILLGDFLRNFRETRGREPGYMDFTRGLAPSNLITDEMLTKLQKAGYKKGGLAQACSCMHKKQAKTP